MYNPFSKFGLVIFKRFNSKESEVNQLIKYVLIMKDARGVEWAADGFCTVTDAMTEAAAKCEHCGWSFVAIKPYKE